MINLWISFWCLIWFNFTWKMHTSISVKISAASMKSCYLKLTHQIMNFLLCISTSSCMLKSKWWSFEKSFSKYYRVLILLRLVILRRMLKKFFLTFNNDLLIDLMYMIFFFSNLFFIFIIDLIQILKSFLKWIWVISFFAWSVLILLWTNLNQSHIIMRTNFWYYIIF